MGGAAASISQMETVGSEMRLITQSYTASTLPKELRPADRAVCRQSSFSSPPRYVVSCSQCIELSEEMVKNEGNTGTGNDGRHQCRHLGG